MSAEAYTRTMDLFTGILLGYMIGYFLWLVADWYFTERPKKIGKGKEWIITYSPPAKTNGELEREKPTSPPPPPPRDLWPNWLDEAMVQHLNKRKKGN